MATTKVSNWERRLHVARARMHRAGGQAVALIDADAAVEESQQPTSPGVFPGFLAGTLATCRPTDHIGLLVVRPVGLGDGLSEFGRHQWLDAMATAELMMRQLLGERDGLWRTSPDTFALMLSDLRSPGELANIADQLQSLLREIDPPLGFHIGAAVGRLDSDAPMVVEAAQVALRVAERSDRSVVLADERLTTSVAERAARSADLRKAITARNIGVMYRPVLDVESLHPVLIDAEWHTDEADLADRDLLGAARRAGLVERVEALFYLAMGADLSARRLQLGDHVGLTLNAGREAHTTAHTQRLMRLAAVEALSIAGVPLWIDVQATAIFPMSPAAGTTVVARDFCDLSDATRRAGGTGALQVKVGRELVTQLHSRLGRCLLGAMVDEARAQGARVIAEGVRTNFELQTVRDLGCQLVQGDLLAPAMTAARVSALIAQTGSSSLPSTVGVG